MEPIYFDTHAHYDSERFAPDREALLASLPERGVALVVNPGCDLASSRAAVDYAHRFAHVYAAVGWHPEQADEYDAQSAGRLRAWAEDPRVVAIGEVGLDYYWAENPPREVQQRVLAEQMALAGELNLPVIFHDREAHADSLAMVRRFPEVRGVFHCWSGSPEMADELIRLGWYISFTGSITFKNARRAPETIARLPMDRIMIETDAPYMTPVPHRGERNDSAYLPLIARRIGEIRGISGEEVARLTLANGRRFFGLDGEEKSGGPSGPPKGSWDKDMSLIG